MTVAGWIITFSQTTVEAPRAATTSCNTNTLTPNYAAEVNIFGQDRWVEPMLGVPLDVYVDPLFATFGIDAPVRLGVQSWAVASNGRVGLVRFVNSSADADIDVEFGAPGVVPSQARAAAGLFVLDGKVRSATISFAFDYFIKANCNGPECSTDVMLVAAHEMGHVLGLETGGPDGQGHTVRTDSIMYYLTSGAVLSPTTADVNTMRIAYGCR